MPIDIDEFESASAEQLRAADRSVREQVVEFLRYDPELAYSREELEAALDVDTFALVHHLSALEREGVLRHKGRYWAIADEVAGGDSIGERL